MEKSLFHVIIIACDEKKTQPLPHKATQPIHGKPALDWVVDAFHNSPSIGNITVVGPESLETLACMRHVHKRIPGGLTIIQHILHGITYIKTSVYHGSPKHNGYLISFCDAVCLTPDIIEQTVAGLRKTTEDMILHYVRKDAFHTPWSKHYKNCIPINNTYYLGTSLYYIRRLGGVMHLLPELLSLHTRAQHIKDIVALFRSHNHRELSSLAATLSGHSTNTHIALRASLHPALTFHADTPKNITLAEKTLPLPWRISDKKTQVIYNPNAGQGQAIAPIWQHLLGIKTRKRAAQHSEEMHKLLHNQLAHYGIDADITATKYAGHATEIARGCVVKGYSRVIAVGGDGTINEVINGLAGSEVTLGIIPLGTANVLAMELNIPFDITAACQVIAEGKTTTIDLGRAGNRYFSCMAGIGFDAHVLRRADSHLKKTYGGMAYAMVGLMQLFTYRFRAINIKIDNQPMPRKGYFAIIGNGRYYGGKLPLTTHADLTDGYLDICIFKHKHIFSVLCYIFGPNRGNIDKHLALEYFQCKHITVEKKGNHPVHVDAEYLCDTPVEISVVPSALRVII